MLPRQGSKKRSRTLNRRTSYRKSLWLQCHGNVTLIRNRMVKKKKNDVRIIREGGQYHVFLGTADVWLNQWQLERLYEEVRKQLAE